MELNNPQKIEVAVLGTESSPELKEKSFSPSSADLAAAGFKKLSRQYSVDSIEKYDATVTIRMWFKAGVEVVKAVVQTENGADTQPFLASITYRRDDASAAVGSPCIGLTLLIASEMMGEAKSIKIALVFNNKEVLTVDGLCRGKEFHELLEGITFDLARQPLSVETYLAANVGQPLMQFMRGAWSLYLNKQVHRHSVIKIKGKSVPKYSSITVFYRNTALAELFPLLSSVFDAGPDVEVVLCFQEAVLFQRQIEWLRHMAAGLGLNLTIVLFESNVGFSAGNNIGVLHSSGKVVQLLNPDIICTNAQVYIDILRRAGSKDAIYGATLLGAGGDVMHNGISLSEEIVFEGRKPTTVLRTAHIARHAPASSIRSGSELKVDAITGALIAIKKDLYIEMGGLSTDYIFAHFEDIDFCLKAAKKGISTYVYQNSEITHVESVSSGENGMSRVIKFANSVTFNNLFGAKA
jgi:hypothetical protein